MMDEENKKEAEKAEGEDGENEEAPPELTEEELEEQEEKQKVFESLQDDSSELNFVRAPDETGRNAPPLWLVTFTDVMALMLTFFVLLYSMAVPEEELWTTMTSALNSELGKFYSDDWEQGAQDTINIDKIESSKALDLDYLETIVQELISKEENLDDIVIIPQKDHLVISLPDNILFNTGEAEVIEEGKDAIFSLGGTLSRIKNRIEVIGHADPRPISGENAPYPSNWELSLARALNVAGILETVGYRRPITVRGLSSARYDELPDINEEARLSYARRVDIVVMEDDGSRSNLVDFGL